MNSESNKIKPIIVNTNKIDVKNIINRINIRNIQRADKRKNSINQKNNITKRNIDFIKVIQKRGTIYNNSKEKAKKKLEIKKCQKFSDNPQFFFTEELCSNVLKSYNLKPKSKSRSNSSKKNK